MIQSKLNANKTKFLTLNIIFAILSFVNLVLIIICELYSVDNGYEFAFLFPFIGGGLLGFGTVIYFLVVGTQDGMRDPYIKQKYPEIWSKLHPWGDMSANGFAAIEFIKGRYDDGGDERLNQVKAYIKTQFFLCYCPFGVLLSSWLLGILFIVLFNRL